MLFLWVSGEGECDYPKFIVTYVIKVSLLGPVGVPLQATVITRRRRSDALGSVTRYCYSWFSEKLAREVNREEGLWLERRLSPRQP